MTPESILADLLESGIAPAVTLDGQAIVVPAGRLSPSQRAAIIAHKAQLINYLLDTSRVTARLLKAAMRVCDEYGDGPQAREEMRQDVLNTPAHLRQDLLRHLSGGRDNASRLPIFPRNGP